MQIINENEIVLGNSKPGTSFKIAASSKAFKILSSTIYKNKIRAVVRELVCNAVDAHVLNSQTKPYEIHVPTNIDPRFVVRDFGPGLSHEDMVELYTTYFASTKAERNDQIGALGLGSKSPFSYTPTFSVISYHDGVVRSYQCMLSNGEPSITKTFESPFVDGDQTGIQVIVPAKTTDLNEWRDEIEYIMRPFPSKSFEIFGDELDIKSFDLLENYSSDYFNVSGDPNDNLYAIYGNIVYPLTGIKQMDGSWLTASRGSTYIHFPLGELDIQPSREELSLDEVTIANVIKRVNLINTKKRDDDCKRLHQITNKRQLARELFKLPGRHWTVLVNSNYLIDGKTLTQLTTTDENQIGMKLYEIFNTTCRVYGQSTYGAVALKTLRSPDVSKYRRQKQSEVDFVDFLTYKDERLFILEKDDKHTFRQTLDGCRLDKNPRTPKRKDYVIAIHSGDPRNVELLKRLHEIMGDDEIIHLKTSELEDSRKFIPGYGVKKPKAKPEEKRPTSPNAYKVQLNQGDKYWSTSTLYLNSKDISEMKGFVIGQHRDDACIFSDNFRQVHNLTPDTIRNLARKKDVTEFYIVRPSIFERVKKNQNVKCLVEFVINEYKRLIHLVQPNEYFYSGDTSRFFSNLKKYEEFEDLKTEFQTHPNPLASQLNDFYYHLDGKIWSGEFGIIVRAMGKHYDECMERQESIHDKLIDQFRKKYPTVYFYMNNNYSVDKSIRESIVEQIKILKANGI